METRKLGNAGLEVTAMGLGCMGMSEFYGSTDDTESTATIDLAYDLGVRFFDTADMYGPYKNEILVGKALGVKRKNVILATKFGIVRTEDPMKRGINGRPEYVRKSCEGSLQRLGTDFIDLYYQHRVDPNVPIEETVGAMSDLVREGKIRFIGLSEAGPRTIERANSVHPITAVQTEYSLWTRDPENEIFETVNRLGVGFVAYSPLGRGFLTGTYKNFDDFPEDDYRRYSPRFQGENFKKNLLLVDKIVDIANSKGISPSQLALAWVLNRGKFIVPIPGTKRRKYMEENAKAAEVTFTDAEISEISEFFPPDAVHGLRYPEAVMKSIDK